jgi:hypothetical protein
VGDFEMQFTAEAPFNFPGGGHDGCGGGVRAAARFLCGEEKEGVGLSGPRPQENDVAGAV